MPLPLINNNVLEVPKSMAMSLDSHECKKFAMNYTYNA
jgi:hypothetical protein